MNVFFPALDWVLVAALIMTLLSGCAINGTSKAGKGAAAGAVVGAGVGLLMGALTGDSRVAAVGAAVGGGVRTGQSAYEGWKQDQDDERKQQITEAIRDAKQLGAFQQQNTDRETRAREEFTRFLGIWAMEGWIQEPGQARLSVGARVNADIQMNYFVGPA